MLDIYLVREVLEDIAARILATKVTDAQIEPFGGQCRSATKYLKSGHPDRYYFAALEITRPSLRSPSCNAFLQCGKVEPAPKERLRANRQALRLAHAGSAKLNDLFQPKPSEFAGESN